MKYTFSKMINKFIWSSLNIQKRIMYWQILIRNWHIVNLCCHSLCGACVLKLGFSYRSCAVMTWLSVKRDGPHMLTEVYSRTGATVQVDLSKYLEGLLGQLYLENSTFKPASFIWFMESSIIKKENYRAKKIPPFKQKRDYLPNLRNKCSGPSRLVSPLFSESWNYFTNAANEMCEPELK